MAIPPVKLFSNEPGGGLNVAMKANNALANDMILRQMNQIKKQYLPTTMQAEAASKLAYANLMGPQFMAKLLQNPGAIANMGDDAAKAALQSAVSAGMGRGTGNAFNQMPQPVAPKNNSLGEDLISTFKSMIGMGRPSQPSPNPMNNMGGGSQYNAPAEYPSPPAVNEPGDNIDHGIDAAWSKWLASPEGQKEMNREGGMVMPSDEYIRDWAKNNKPMNIEMNGGKRNDRTYGEKAADYQALQSEGKETGTIRAKQRQELDDQYQQAAQAEVPMEHLNEIVTNPMFRKLRRDGAFQKLQLDAKEITGTPEEKQLIGDFQTTALKALSESIMGWRGRILDKEVGISNTMKVGPKDSIDSMLGKMPSIETFNEMTKQRARIASQLMRDQHLSKGDALEAADRQVNGKAIRERINKQLNLKSPTETARPDFKKMSNEELQAYIGG